MISSTYPVEIINIINDLMNYAITVQKHSVSNLTPALYFTQKTDILSGRGLEAAKTYYIPVEHVDSFFHIKKVSWS